MQIDWPDAPRNISAISTLRSGGVSLPPYDDGAGGGGFNLGIHVADNPVHVQQNRARLRQLLPADPAWLTQIHGTTVLDAASVIDAPDADASISTEAGVVCAILTADCLPILFSDVAGAVVGAAHAGWRGLAAGVLQQTVAAMRLAGASEIVAWLGPAIGPQQFEVGQDVVDAFVTRDPHCATAFRPFTGRPGKYFADIALLARQTLATIGVERVAGGEQCTVTDRERYFSFRRDQQTGRMASLIWINP
ncbi:peptidoglycan editing factor PgeF [Actimicrobium antarcticum]|uniref:Purine nucleoside phosphorylase n=2 Tax=Actimicrobium antarcticum TaxID=1051899 RepID=A0ABP7TQ90_9BURK